MRRAKELMFRMLNGLILLMHQKLLKIFGVETVYKTSQKGVSASFEGGWFVYRAKEFGCTGNIDFVPEAENATRNALFSRMKDGDIFYDIGAHGGVYTITAKKRNASIIVHSFEPQPRDLLANLELSGLSVDNVHPIALGDSDGAVTMTASRRSSNHVVEHGEVTVQVRELDRFASERKLPPPQWIKIDIEGYELPAMKGARQLLKNHQPVVICEINKISGRYGTKPKDLIEYMEGMGYKIHAFINDTLSPVQEPLPYSANWNYWFLPKT